MSWYLVVFILGVVVGIIVGDKLGIGTDITNEIGKIKNKGDNGVIDVDQKQEPQPEKRKGLLKRIFTKKSKI